MTGGGDLTDAHMIVLEWYARHPEGRPGDVAEALRHCSATWTSPPGSASTPTRRLCGAGPRPGLASAVGIAGKSRGAPGLAEHEFSARRAAH